MDFTARLLDEAGVVVAPAPATAQRRGLHPPVHHHPDDRLDEGCERSARRWSVASEGQAWWRNGGTDRGRPATVDGMVSDDRSPPHRRRADHPARPGRRGQARRAAQAPPRAGGARRRGRRRVGRARERSVEELHRLAETAGAEVLDTPGPAAGPPRRRHLHRQGQGQGAGRHRQGARGRHRDHGRRAPGALQGTWRSWSTPR